MHSGTLSCCPVKSKQSVCYLECNLTVWETSRHAAVAKDLSMDHSFQTKYWGGVDLYNIQAVT